MEILGRDSTREAYRVAIGGDAEARVVGYLPDRVISRSLPLVGGRGHQTAYDWIARHSHDIETTLRTLQSGQGRIRPPFDQIVLETE